MIRRIPRYHNDWAPASSNGVRLWRASDGTALYPEYLTDPAIIFCPSDVETLSMDTSGTNLTDVTMGVEVRYT